jgi:hypothetical protein
MSLNYRKTQLAARVGTEGTYNAAVESATYANILLFEPKAVVNVAQHERNPLRSDIGALPSIPGSRLGNITFRTEVKGSGTPGTAPAWGVLLRACGFGETVESGTASNTAIAARPGNKSTVVIGPAITGTFNGAKNGRYVLTLESLSVDTSAVFRWQFFPDDGTAFSTGTVTITDTNPTVMNSALSLATTLDPNTSTTGWRIGDQWTFRATSSSSVQVVYKTVSDPACLDLAIYQDGRLFKFHSARGSVRLAGRVGEPAMLEFTFQAVPQGEPSDSALLTGIAFDDVTPPVFQGVVATLGGVEPACYSTFEMDVQNVLSARQCAGSASGYDSVKVTDRNVTGSLDTEAELIAAATPHADMYAGALNELDLTWGEDAGNIININARNVQVLGVDDSEREGIRVDALSLGFRAPEYDAGDEFHEVAITLT